LTALTITTQDMTHHNQDIWQFFDRRVLLTVKNRRDKKPSRLPIVTRELDRIGMKLHDVFYAVDAIGPHQSFTLSQKQILTDFIDSDSKRLLVLEDDVEFRDLQPLREAIFDINLHNTNCDILYLGGNLLNGRVLEKRRHICRVNNVWTTHAVSYSRFAAAALLQHFPNENEVMFDTYLGSMLSQFKAYMVSPMVAVQRPDFSDIWGHDVNYTSIFDRSNKMMR
jgi:hypothetical protein